MPDQPSGAGNCWRTWGLCVSQSMACTAAEKWPPLCRCWCVGSDLALPLLLVPDDPPELDEVLDVVPELWDCSMAGLVDTLLLVFVPSSAVFLKKLCCRA